MSIDKEMILTHHCLGYMNLSHEPQKRLFECGESQDGLMILFEDKKEDQAIAVNFCPFCGHPAAMISVHHLFAEKEVQHAILD